MICSLPRSYTEVYLATALCKTNLTLDILVALSFELKISTPAISAQSGERSHLFTFVLVFSMPSVYELGISTGRTDGRTDEQARRGVMRPIKTGE